MSVRYTKNQEKEEPAKGLDRYKTSELLAELERRGILLGLPS